TTPMPPKPSTSTTSYLPPTLAPGERMVETAILLGGADDGDRRCVVLAAGLVGGSDQLAAHRLRVVMVCGENDFDRFFGKHSGDTVAAQHVEVARTKLEEEAIKVILTA